jgi:phytoene dehydrogenase-like protein
VSKPDVIVIGAGHNGLACALRLQRAGKKVLVVEARDDVGGLCAPRTLEGGYTVPGVLPDTGEVRGALCDSLGLFGVGLELGTERPALLLPEADGEGLVLDGQPDKACDAIKKRSAPDADAYRALLAFIDRVRPVLVDALNRAPPPLNPSGAGDLLDLGMRGLALRRLGRDDMVELMRLLPMAVADLVRERFETERLCAGLAGGVLPGNWVGPWSPGTSTTFLLSEAIRGGTVKGGGAALVAAAVKALSAAGGEIRTGAEVAELLIDKGSVRGVRLVDGTTLEAPQVASAASPIATLLDLVPAGLLDMGTEHEASAIRGRGRHAVVHLGLSSPLTFAGHDGQRFEHIRIGEHLDDLERAYDVSKYRSLPERPALEVRVPSVGDPSLAPEGHEVVSIVVTSATAELEGGWTDDARATLLSRTLAVLDEVAPGTSDNVAASEVLAPPDLEDAYHLPGGNLLHVEHALDQLLFLRPSLSLGRYRTPVPGLWLCGAGSHPGGGLTLAPGALAAQAMLGSPPPRS